MGDSTDETESERVEREVDWRLQALRNDREALEAYRDEAEGEPSWGEIRRRVRAEVREEIDRRENESTAEQEATLLEGRYELLEELGRGGQGVAHRARDRETDSMVVVKELAVGEAPDWKAIELFEREAETLQSVDHPRVPDYVDAFRTQSDDGDRFFLVQSFVDGESLEQLVDDGYRVDGEGARTFLRSVLLILADLHGLEPPVIHRDIKPSNIVRRPDGEWVLVDFGAVQNTMSEEEGGSTVVGTAGFTPVEQLMGAAEPASDLYALGATTIYLLSHRHPADLEMQSMQLQFRDAVNVSEHLADYLDWMVAPDAADRFSSAEAALEALDRIETEASELQSRSSSDEPLEKAPGRRRRSNLVPDPSEVDSPEDDEDSNDMFWPLAVGAGMLIFWCVLPLVPWSDGDAELRECCDKCDGEIVEREDSPDATCKIEVGSSDKKTEQEKCIHECMDGQVEHVESSP